MTIAYTGEKIPQTSFSSTFKNPLNCLVVLIKRIEIVHLKSFCSKRKKYTSFQAILKLQRSIMAKLKNVFFLTSILFVNKEINQ